MKRALLTQLLADRAAKRPAVLITDLSSGEQTLVHPSDGHDQAVDRVLLEAARRALQRDVSSVVEHGPRELFVQPFNPPLRMVIVGAVHIAQSLVKMAAMHGFEVQLVDPRRAFASEHRFPGVTLVREWPDRALEALAPDRRTAVITLTHDPKLDEPALRRALESGAFYVGALGSRRTHAARRERLAAAGVAEADLERIHGPVGLPIGASTSVEIATSIMAEVIQRLRQGTG